LFDEALQFDSAPSISVLLTQRSESLFDRFAVFPRPLFLRLWLNHARFEQRKDQGELLFALGLSSENSPGLLRLTSPLPVPVILRGPHGFAHLFVGIFAVPCAKVVQLIPERHDRRVDDLARHIEQAQGILLGRIRSANGIA